MGIGNGNEDLCVKIVECGGELEWEWELGMGMSDIPKYCVIIRGIWCYLCKNCGMRWGIRE